MLFFRAILLFSASLVLASLMGCRQSPDALMPAPSRTGKELATLVPGGRSTPAETFLTYIEALKADRFDQALDCLYMPSTNKMETVLNGFAPLAEKIRLQKWMLHVEATGEQDRFAAIVYTTNADKSDFEPVLAVRETDGTWKLHHRSLSGGLSRIFAGREYDNAMKVVQWGRDKVVEFKMRQADKEPRKPS